MVETQYIPILQTTQRSLRVQKVGGSNPGFVKYWKTGTCCFPGSNSPFRVRV